MEMNCTGMPLGRALAALEAEGVHARVERIEPPPGFRPRDRYLRLGADYVAACITTPEGEALVKVVSVPAEPQPAQGD